MGDKKEIQNIKEKLQNTIDAMKYINSTLKHFGKEKIFDLNDISYNNIYHICKEYSKENKDIINKFI